MWGGAFRLRSVEGERLRKRVTLQAIPAAKVKLVFVFRLNQLAVVVQLGVIDTKPVAEHPTNRLITLITNDTDHRRLPNRRNKTRMTTANAMISNQAIRCLLLGERDDDTDDAANDTDQSNQVAPALVQAGATPRREVQA